MTTSKELQRWRWGAGAAIVTLAILAAPASAQNPGSGGWQRGTVLTTFGGAGTASSQTDVAAGVSLGWEVAPRLIIEGRGVWFNANTGSSEFTAILGPRIPLRPARRWNPYVSTGVGMFRSTFDSTATNIPDFYLSRIDPAGPRAGTFDDFLYTVGGGLDIFVNDHFALRPEWSVLFVTSGSDTRAVHLYGVTIAYHFEHHPIE